jgi:hypothetical protein
MDFHLRVHKTSTEKNVTLTVYANGLATGNLVMTFQEYSAFGRALLIGARDIEPPTSVRVDTVLVKV